MKYLGVAVSSALYLALPILAACTAGHHSGPGGGDHCTPACTTGQSCCMTSTGLSYACSPVTSDPNNCGGCGIQCASGQRCLSGHCSGTPTDAGPLGATDTGPGATGTCSPTCSSTQRCCGTTCVSRNGVTLGTDGHADSSFMNCNGCGIACNASTASSCSMPTGGGAPGCHCGTFPACDAPMVCATGMGGTFSCVNMSSDPNNCGSVGHRCAEGETCTAGVCGCGGHTCGTGEACCAGGCVNTMTSADNCGMCGTSCGGGTCSGGHCLCGGRACREASSSDLGEICCGGSCVASDAMNCGTCGTMCTSGTMCINGMSLTGTGMMVCCGIGLGGGGLPFDAGIPTGGGGGICLPSGFP